jgi:hypothetical protein
MVFHIHGDESDGSRRILSGKTKCGANFAAHAPGVPAQPEMKDNSTLARSREPHLRLSPQIQEDVSEGGGGIFQGIVRWSVACQRNGD